MILNNNKYNDIMHMIEKSATVKYYPCETVSDGALLAWRVLLARGHRQRRADDGSRASSAHVPAVTIPRRDPHCHHCLWHWHRRWRLLPLAGTGTGMPSTGTGAGTRAGTSASAGAGTGTSTCTGTGHWHWHWLRHWHWHWHWPAPNTVTTSSAAETWRRR